MGPIRAPEHCDEIIRLIDNALGESRADDDANPPASVDTPAGEPVVETRARVDCSIVCRPSGGLDWIGAVSLRLAVHDALRHGIDILIDLSRVDFIDAVGMSALVGCVRRVRAVGGEAVICNATPHVRQRMELVGVYNLLTHASARNDNDVA
jgi:anti-anti-sigma factor